MNARHRVSLSVAGAFLAANLGIGDGARVKARLALSVGLMALAAGTALAAPPAPQKPKHVRIGLVIDGPSEAGAEFAGEFRDEILELYLGPPRAWLLPTVGLEANVADRFLEGGDGASPPTVPPQLATLVPPTDDVTWSVSLALSFPLFLTTARYADIEQAERTVATVLTLVLVPVLHAIFVVDLGWVEWPKPPPVEPAPNSVEPVNP